MSFGQGIDFELLINAKYLLVNELNKLALLRVVLGYVLLLVRK